MGNLGKDIGNGLGVTNICDLVLKETYGIYEKRKLTKEEMKDYKWWIKYKE